MTTPSSPPIGLIGLTSISGDVGRLIRFGQWLNGDGFTTWEHAFISIGGGLIVEAEPGGARVAHASEYSTVHWCHGLASLANSIQLENTEVYAKHYVGVPYSFADYLALSAHRLHIPAPDLQRYISTSRHMICSQLVDACYAQSGIKLFKDGRWAGDVTPGDLYQLDISITPKGRPQ
jgi:uncharacterized protein YycO